MMKIMMNNKNHYDIRYIIIIVSFIIMITFFSNHNNISFRKNCWNNENNHYHHSFVSSFSIIKQNNRHILSRRCNRHYDNNNNNNIVLFQQQQSQQEQEVVVDTDKKLTTTKEFLYDTIYQHIHILTNQGSDIRGRYDPITFDDNDDKNNNMISDHDHDDSILMNILHQFYNNNDSTSSNTKIPSITTFICYCLGYSFVKQQQQINNNNNILNIAIGHDCRIHGSILSLSFIYGAMRATSNNDNINIQYIGLTTTPACATFCNMNIVQAAVMLTASHLPPDRNGFKLFSKTIGSIGGYNKKAIQELGIICQQYVSSLLLLNDNNDSTNDNNNNNKMMINDVIMDMKKINQYHNHDNNNHHEHIIQDLIPCEYHFDWMQKYYAPSLRKAIIQQITDSSSINNDNDNDNSNDINDDDINYDINKPLNGLKIVLNVGHGAGGFFAYDVLNELGADVSGSLYLQPDGTFPNGYVPNPESSVMIDETIQHCQLIHADLGILLDTDADRCGFVIPIISDKEKHQMEYVSLNRNRLIALLSVIFSIETPNCTIVTDSVTSEGLSNFLINQLNINHVRYIKGYANVIQKAIELTNIGIPNVRMAIETSGHCAMKENYYMDDGTYTAVRIVSFLASNIIKQKQQNQNNNNEQLNLFDFISTMKELAIVTELRINVIDGSLVTMNHIFQQMIQDVIQYVTTKRMNDEGVNNPITDSSSLVSFDWEIDYDNVEPGIRIRLNSYDQLGQFFMIRKSLHDPIISIQIEVNTIDNGRQYIIEPLIHNIWNTDQYRTILDLSILSKF